MNFKNIRIYIASLILFMFWSCADSDKQSPFQGDYLLNSMKLGENCQSKMIDFLAPMELENDTSKITDIYQLFILPDTTIYEEDEFDKVIFLGLIFNNDSLNKEILACDPEYGMIYFTYLVKKGSTVLIGNNSLFLNNFKRIENIACLITPDSLHYAEIKGSSIRYWQVAGNSTINGCWMPDTVSQLAFSDTDLNNEWQVSGDLEIKQLKLVDTNNNILVSDKLDFGWRGIQLLNKEKEFMIMSTTKKAIYLYDYDNKITHQLKRKK